MANAVVAVGVVVGRADVRLLRDAGYDVIEAKHGEPDREWFERALVGGVGCIISADSDLEILCYDHRIEFFRAREGHSGQLTAERFILRYGRIVAEESPT